MLCSVLEKAMAPHSSTLAWKIPWTEEPGGLQTWLYHLASSSLQITTHRTNPSVISSHYLGLYSPQTKNIFIYLCFVVVQSLSSVVSDSLQPHELQYTRLICPSLSPWVFSNLCPLNQWCHPTIFSSVTPFSSCPRFFHHQEPHVYVYRAYL